MAQAVQKAIAEYNRIRDLFLSGDPSAEEAWRNFVANGYGIAMPYIGK